MSLDSLELNAICNRHTHVANSGRFTFLNSVMLSICFDNFIANEFVVWFNRNKRRLDWAVWRLENDRTRFYTLEMSADMSGNILQPILWATSVAQFALMQVHFF